VKTGDRFGRWTVEIPYNSPAKALCRCECGTLREVSRGSLKAGHSLSCGCLRIEATVIKSTTHGKSKTLIYRVWAAMVERCESSSCRDYKDYGGRGITVCHEWRNSFENFYADMGDRPFEGASLDRINVNGPYTKENCRWATPSEQARNRRDAMYLTHNGETKHVAEWAEETGISLAALKTRKLRGWSDFEALTLPYNFRYHRKAA
jgi:hypothetical protein